MSQWLFCYRFKPCILQFVGFSHFQRVWRRAEEGTLVLFFFLQPAIKEKRRSDRRIYSSEPQNTLALFLIPSLKKGEGKGKWWQNQYKPIITSHLWKLPEWLCKILRHIQVHFSRADIYQKSFAPKQMLFFIVLLSQMTKIYDRQLQHL